MALKPSEVAPRNAFAVNDAYHGGPIAGPHREHASKEEISKYQKQVQARIRKAVANGAGK